MPSRPKPKPEPTWQLTFPATGTEWSIDVYDTISTDQQTSLATLLRDRVELFEQTYSRFRQDSFTSQLAHAAATYELPDDAAPLLDLYHELYDISGGLLTPLIGQTLVDAGYDAHYGFIPKDTVQPAPTWDEIIKYEPGDTHITIKRTAQLDFGAIGKGYLVDILSQILSDADITGFCVDAGGDMYCRHPHQPLQIGLENPERAHEIIGTALLRDGALCGSAGNRRRWSTYHHIINPDTATSPEHVRAIWVTADSAMLADGLTTCLFFTPASILKKRYTFEYIMVMDNGSAEYSPDFPGQLFTKNT